MRNTLLELAREYESGKGKGGCALLRYLRAGIRNALLELTIKNPEKKGGWMLYYVICEQEYGAAL